MYITIDEEMKAENWTINRMKAIVADMPAQKWHENFCPECRIHHSRHDDTKCIMHFTEEL